MSSLDAGSANIFLTCLIDCSVLKFPLVLGFSSIEVFFLISFSSGVASSFIIVANTLPSETLSPILTFKSLIFHLKEKEFQR